MKTRFRYFTRAGVIVLFVIFTCLGCSGFGQKIEKWQTAVKEKLNFTESESPTEAEKRNSDIYFIHTSRYSWETLGIVADWYTGDSRNWKKLAEINPDVDPPKVAAGSEIFIPVKLLKTRKALPQDYAGNYCKKCYRHTVRWAGESLSLIARWYTGASRNWRKLAKANPRLNPNRIKKGNVIVIPPALLKTREPLPQKVAARYTAGYFAYIVKQDGEKMEVIASWYTGNAANWKVIARANPKLNSNHLVAGNEIFIPSKLLKTRQPIPNSQPAPTAETPKLKPATVEKKMPAVEEEEIKIFGPKQFPKS
ncbi:MAG: LysM peptidoglycan-binding domain-containing protein [Proteobacteria bacterium]|nr:LysM peptidoglycan-binding domain-containing protein [Pseudomonadota bacterium]